MKKLLTFATLLLASSKLMAAQGQAVLEIEFVGAASATHPVVEVQGQPTVGFDSTTQLGACPLSEGKVYFEGNTDDTYIFSILLAAQASGAPVKIYWNDAHVNSRGYCKLEGVRLY